MDLFVVPTIGFNLLYAFIIIRLDRRDLVWINVTTNPTAEWIAHQITEAFLGMRLRDTCVYRKLKPGRSDGEARRGSGVNE